METSEQINELSAALAAAQGELKPALKTALNAAFARGSNPGSKYATLADCVETAHPTLSKHKLAMVQGICGAEFFARLVHASGQWIQIRVPIPGDLSKMTIQQLMAIQTYLRRGTYSLVGLSSDEDDDGNEAAKVGAVKQGIGIHSPMGETRASPQAFTYASALKDAVSTEDAAKVYQIHLDLKDLGEEMYRDTWALLDSKTRSTAKKLIDTQKAAAA